MLQVITGKFYPDGIEIHSTIHRGVVYTNRWLLDRAPIDLPLATLEAETQSGPIVGVTLSITEKMAAVHPDGTPSPLVATGGGQLLDDYADLLSFGLNSVFYKDLDLVRKLVPKTSPNEEWSGAASRLFRGTFDPSVTLLDAELDEFRVFVRQVLALGRADYEAVMRAVRRVARATRTAASDPTGAYADIVAALESLSAGADVPHSTWEQLVANKRAIFDAAFEGLDQETTGRLQEAVMTSEHLGLASRFRAFTLANTSPSFFREESSEAIRPIREPDLDKALRRAYDVRSRSVHTLWDLPPEAWVFGDRADTAEPLDLGVILSLEGMARLARHVIRSHVVSLEPVEAEDFDWTKAIPNVLHANLAAQLWLPHAEGFNHEHADKYFRGVAEHFLDLHLNGGTEAADMTAVLKLIEEQVPGLAVGTAKTQMVAMYFVWHRVLAPDAHLDGADAFLDEHVRVLEAPSMTAFVAFLLTGLTPEWSPDEWLAVSDERQKERKRPKSKSFEPLIEASLYVSAANALLDANRREDAAAMIALAIGELPGRAELIAWEESLATEKPLRVDPKTLVFPGQETE